MSRFRFAWWVPLALLMAGAAQAQPYKRTQAKGQNFCIYWDQRTFVYHPDSAGYSLVPGESMFTTIDASFQTWQTLSDWCSGFKFSAGNRIPNAHTGYVSGGTNENVVVFREANCASAAPPDDPCWASGTCANAYRCWDHSDLAIALTTAHYTVDTGLILDADIELNAAPPAGGGDAYFFTTADGPPCATGQRTGCVSTDLRNTLTHEIGHVIGLDHAPSLTSTMFATAEPGETRKRIIDVGTSQALCDIYPRAQPSASACAVGAVANAAITGSNRGTSVPTLGCSSVRPGRGLGLLLAFGLMAFLLSRRQRA